MPKIHQQSQFQAGGFEIILNLRPVFPRKTERVAAHLLVCFLTLALWRTLEQWMRGKGLGDCARQLVKEGATVRSLDVVLPVKEPEREQTCEVRLRVVARPDRAVAELLVRLGLDLPSAPQLVQNVVEKNGVCSSKTPAIPHFRFQD